MAGVDLFGEFRLQRDLIKVRHMNQGAGLLADRGDLTRVAMAEGADCDSSAEVEVGFSRIVPESASLATHGHEGKAAIRRQDVALEEIGSARHWGVRELF